MECPIVNLRSALLTGFWVRTPAACCDQRSASNAPAEGEAIINDPRPGPNALENAELSRCVRLRIRRVLDLACGG
jgi:hypothetical protein